MPSTWTTSNRLSPRVDLGSRCFPETSLRSSVPIFQRLNMPARSEGTASNVNRGLGASLSASEPVAVPPEEARDLDQRAYTNNTTRLQIFSIVVFIPARE